MALTAWLGFRSLNQADLAQRRLEDYLVNLHGQLLGRLDRVDGSLNGIAERLR